ncbi:type II toxin-antitoxin system Phd/YefM family antitoxin [Collinsella provencensis]|uniref:type II toxin-antitoxin system Phd/YefM family antitoxin n=1 Tax=Collinsella provencensis TaxID=1937461 RepID=UPI000C821588|nr:type II toxin-antitoxin system Phd/YefM family antitoxin [Collinsella provencensis]
MVIAPIKELKDGAAISAKCHELNEPIHITKNGYGDMVIMSTEVFERYDRIMQRVLERELRHQQELEEIVEDFRAGMADYKAGNTRDGFEVLSELRAQYDL